MTKVRSVVRTKEKDTPSSIAITPIEINGIQAFHRVMNAKLWDDALPDDVVFTSRTRADHGGHFSPNRYTDRLDETVRYHEIALNYDGFTGHDDKFIGAILVHEQCHLWQEVCGRPPSRAYHDRQWATKMEEVGLMPSSTGRVGGKRTGARMSHFIIPGGLYDRVFDELAATGWHFNFQSTIVRGVSKTKKSKATYICPACGANAWAKPNSHLVCETCLRLSLSGLPWFDEERVAGLDDAIRAAVMQEQSAVQPAGTEVTNPSNEAEAA